MLLDVSSSPEFFFNNDTANTLFYLDCTRQTLHYKVLSGIYEWSVFFFVNSDFLH